MLTLIFFYFEVEEGCHNNYINKLNKIIVYSLGKLILCYILRMMYAIFNFQADYGEVKEMLE